MNPIAYLSNNIKKAFPFFGNIFCFELRNGVRTQLFLCSLLFLQPCLGLLVVANMQAIGPSDLYYQNELFWRILAFNLLVLLPISGLYSISPESKDPKISDASLSVFSAMELVIAKGGALYCRSFFYILAALPYFVQRHFIGAHGFISDFERVVFLLWLSGILIAMSLFFSRVCTPTARTVLLAGFMCFVYSIRKYERPFWLDLLRFYPAHAACFLLVLGVGVCGLLFHATVSAIVWRDSNSAIRRLSVLLFIGSLLMLDWMSIDPYIKRRALFWGTYAIILILAYDASAKSHVSQGNHPRQQYPTSLRAFRMFFSPGTWNALLFSITLVLITYLGYFFSTLVSVGTSGWIDSNFFYDLIVLLAVFSSLFGSVLAPLLLARLVGPETYNPFPLIIIYNVVLGMVCGVIREYGDSRYHALPDTFMIFPSVANMAGVMRGGNFDSLSIWILIGNLSCTLSFLFVLALLDRKGLREALGIVSDRTLLKSS